MTTVTDVASTVTAPDGRSWVVRRRFVPRLGAESLWGRFHRRVRQTMRRASNAADADPGCLEALGEGIVALVAILLVLAVLVFVLVPLLVAIVDVLIIVLLALLGLAGRVIFRRPWTVEGSSRRRFLPRVAHRGLRASGEHVAQVVELLGSGVTPPGAVATTTGVKP